jgi:predicted exporter
MAVSLLVLIVALYAAVATAYIEARRACGQDVAKLTPARLEAVLEKQEMALRERYGEETDVRFRVVVEDGRAKLKASREDG